MSAPRGRAAIGVDVGGTRIRAARIGADGVVQERLAEPVSRDRTGFAEQLARLIDALGPGACAAVGIGIPGRVDAARGAVISAGYLDIAGLDLRGLVRNVAGLPCRIENDAAMALVAEAHARGAGTAAMVTVGTGIGGAILQDGALWYGGGLAGQFGHLVVADGGPVCNCGRRGCVETLSAGPALGAAMKRAGMPAGTTAEALLAQAEAGDERARAILAGWAAPLRRALQTLVAAIDPGLMVIGGGLGAAMTRALALDHAEESWFPMPVEPAMLGDGAGIVGAGLRALRAAT